MMTNPEPALGDNNPPEEPTALENTAELRQFLVQSLSTINELKSDRTATNETISSVYARIKERGIPKKAFNMAREYAEMTEQQQLAFDIAYAIVREAAGYPLQGDWVQEAETKPPLSVVGNTPGGMAGETD